VLRSFVSWEQHVHGFLCEQSVQQRLILVPATPSIKPGLDFRQNHERNPDLLTATEQSREIGVTTQKISQPTGI
jgi:hypothetical protein